MKLVLIGASGHGRVCAEIAETLGKYNEIVFLDDNKDLRNCGKYLVEGTTDNLDELLTDNTEFFVSIGNSDFRRRIQKQVIHAGGKIVNLIHPNSVVSNTASIGVGVAVMAGSVINSEAKVGDGVIVNTCSSIDHDCVIGDFCHVAVGAHICGTVSVGEDTWIGAGATVSNNLNICANSMIGAGAVVVSEITKPGTYVGVPAKRI